MRSKFLRIVAIAAALVLYTTAAPAFAQRIYAELETSQLSVADGVAEATFKVVVKNEEGATLSGLVLVFEDGYEVNVGDVAAESSASSDAVTRTFDLSEQIRSLAIPFKATMKYSTDGDAVEQPTTVVLRLNQQ
jgi:hypothetical protein